MQYRLLIPVFFLIPQIVFAECLDKGYTVVFVNGIFNTLEQAEESALSLKERLGKSYRGELVNVTLGYNPTHLAGAGDLLQGAVQGFGGSVSNFDRDTILLQIHPEVTTQKIFLVGHSQGSFYTNNLYDYLLGHGVSKSEVGVYNVATPANYVAGGGRYLTSSYDTIIDAYAKSAQDFGWLPPLASNIDLPLEAYSNGHSFTDVYLAQAGDRMVGDITFGLGRLKPVSREVSIDGCFTPPRQGLGYKTQQAVFAVADPLAIGVKTGAIAAYQGAVAVKNATAAAVGGAWSALASFNPFAKVEPRTENLDGSFSVVKALYGSSLNEAELDDLLGNQGASVALAMPELKPKAPIAPQQEPDEVFVGESVEESRGVVAGIETESPPPLVVPSPSLTPLFSPGFGGGAPAGPEPEPQSDPMVATTTATSTTTTTPAATTAPVVISVSSDGATYSSAIPSPVRIQIGFDVDVSSSSMLVEGVGQAALDCGDADAKTACFDFTLFATEPGVFRNITIIAENSIGTTTDTNHRFIVDTLGPIVVVTTQYAKTQLSTIAGTISDANRPLQVLVNGVYYNVSASGGSWSLIIPAGSELSEGAHLVSASSTDAVGNVGSTTEHTLIVDLTAPAISITSGPAEGESVASTSSVAITYEVTDMLAVTSSCAFDADLLVMCNGSASAVLAPGPHTFTINASDAAGNVSGLTRSFVVLP